MESGAAAVSFSDWGVHRVMLPLLVSLRVVLVAASSITMREHRRSIAARAGVQASGCAISDSPWHGQRTPQRLTGEFGSPALSGRAVRVGFCL